MKGNHKNVSFLIESLFLSIIKTFNYIYMVKFQLHNFLALLRLWVEGVINLCTLTQVLNILTQIFTTLCVKEFFHFALFFRYFILCYIFFLVVCSTFQKLNGGIRCTSFQLLPITLRLEGRRKEGDGVEKLVASGKFLPLLKWGEFVNWTEACARLELCLVLAMSLERYVSPICHAHRARSVRLI